MSTQALRCSSLQKSDGVGSGSLDLSFAAKEGIGAGTPVGSVPAGESMFAGCGDDLTAMAEALERRRTPDFEDAFASWGQVLAERKALDYHSCVECWRMANCQRWESFTAAEGCGAFEVDRPMEVTAV